MTDLLYRHQQILTALRDNIDGMTNKQIIEHCKKMRPNEVPNDITQMGLNTQSLRRRDLLTTADTAAGKIHRITDKGLEILKSAIGDPARNAAPAAQEEQTESTNKTITPHEPKSDCEISQSDAEQNITLEALNQLNPVPLSATDPIAEFDKAVAIMRECLFEVLVNQTYPEPWPKIADKQAKIQLLEKLENMQLLEIWAVDLIAEIRRDIEQLEPAE